MKTSQYTTIKSVIFHYIQIVVFTLFYLSYPPGAISQANIELPEITNDGWLRPFPPVRIINNLYFVGSYELGQFLITTDDGHILINTGPHGSVPLIRSSIEALGFDFNDIKILLTTQAHWDHVGGLAEIKRITGARMLAQQDDSPVLEDGGVSDYKFPNGRDPTFEPVQVDEIINDGDVIELGDIKLYVHHHPGHTRGSTSFSFTTRTDNKDLSVLIVNMGTINSGVNVSGMPGYENITEDFKNTFNSQLELTPDIYVSAHAGHFDLHEKFIPGDEYDPLRFVDQAGYVEKIKYYQKIFTDQLEGELTTK